MVAQEYFSNHSWTTEHKPYYTDILVQTKMKNQK